MPLRRHFASATVYFRHAADAYALMPALRAIDAAAASPDASLVTLRHAYGAMVASRLRVTIFATPPASFAFFFAAAADLAAAAGCHSAAMSFAAAADAARLLPPRAAGAADALYAIEILMLPRHNGC